MRRATIVALAVLLGCAEPEPVERARVRPAVAEADGSAAVDPGATAAGAGPVLCVDTARSLIRWRGTEVGGGGHAGVVRLGGGELRLRHGEVAGGSFTVDMHTIAVTDIPAHEVEARRQLRSHLAHEEFFGVDRFPTARFVITDLTGGEHGLYAVSGNLTVRDSVHNITFEATAPMVTDSAVWASADFSISRRLWGVEFDGRTSALRNAIVHDPIQLEITLVATADACIPVRSTPSPGAGA